MKAYKGFNQKLQCTPDGKVYQYEIGRDYEEPHADLCKNGFHACENPLDVFGYYPPADSRYCEVELGEVSDETSADSKRCAKRIHIGAEIGLTGIINAGVKFVMDKVDWSSARTTNTGNQSAATNTGNRSAASVCGEESIAVVTGYGGKASGAIGCWLVLTERDDSMHILGVQAVCVDGRTIKADTYYKLVNGKVVDADV